MKAEAYKIWKDPEGRNDSPVYMGEFYPSNGQICFFHSDLRALGFPHGHYTVRVPESVRKVYVAPEWQKIIVVE